LKQKTIITIAIILLSVSASIFYGATNVESIVDSILNKQENDGTRQQAMESGSQAKDIRVFDALIKVAEDKDEAWYNRVAALTNANHLAAKLHGKQVKIDPRYYKSIEGIFNDRSNKIDVRIEAIIAYGKVGQNNALPLLIKYLDSEEKGMVTNAVYGIGCVDTKEGRNALIEGYRKQKGTFVESTYVHLFKFYKVKEATPFLIESLNNIHGKGMLAIALKSVYIETLGELGSKEAVVTLKEYANSNDIEFDSLSLAEDAAIALAKMGDYQTIKKVIKKIEIEGRVGVGGAKRARRAYFEITGKELE
jgi:HEAT repeat protein